MSSQKIFSFYGKFSISRLTATLCPEVWIKSLLFCKRRAHSGKSTRTQHYNFHHLEPFKAALAIGAAVSPLPIGPPATEVRSG